MGFFVFAVLLFIAGQILTPGPKVEDARKKSLGDFTIPTASSSRMIPIVFGQPKLSGPNVVWYGDFSQKKVKETVPGSGGIFSSSKEVTVGYQYFIGLQMALCRGPVETDILRIFVGPKEIRPRVPTDEVDNPYIYGDEIPVEFDDFRFDDHEPHFDIVGQVVGEKRWLGGLTDDGSLSGLVHAHSGDPDQQESEYLSQFQDSGAGTNRIPNYGGTAYVVWYGNIGQSTFIEPWSFIVRRLPNDLGLSKKYVPSLRFRPELADSAGRSIMCNPMNAWYEMATNTEWGRSIPTSEIDTAAFIAAGETLITEGNGICWSIDSPIEFSDFTQEIERQVNGRIFRDHQTGKWTVKLARADYDIDTVMELSKATNIVSIDAFSRGSWADTINEVRVTFVDESREYTEQVAIAQDIANMMIQGGGTVVSGKSQSANHRYPGVVDQELAARLATRDLRLLTYPLARATIVVTRDAWELRPFDEVALTDATLGITKMPMRVLKIDYGTLSDGRVTLELVQDAFTFTQAATPSGDGEWVSQSDALVPFVNSLAVEAPRAIVTRDPDAVSDEPSDRIMCAAPLEIGAALGFKIAARVSPELYFQDGDVQSFSYVCTLTAALVEGSTTAATFTITAASQEERLEILNAYTIVSALSSIPEAIGTLLKNMILIDGEWMLVTGVTEGSGNDILLTGVYRGVMDSVQAAHAIGATVWILSSIGLNNSPLSPSVTYDVKLLPYSRYDAVDEATATATSIAMANRVRKPYPPGQLKLNGVADAVSAVSLEGSGSGGDSLGIAVLLTRRDYRSQDEVKALTIDAATIFNDFPNANSTTYSVSARNDPDGANTLLFTLASGAGPTFTLKRTTILKGTNGVIPTKLRAQIATSHVHQGTAYSSIQDVRWDFAPTSALSGRFNFGAINQNVNSNTYTVNAAGVHVATISTALPTGVLQYSRNGGAFTNFSPSITGGVTSGSTVSLSVSDTIVLKHSVSSPSGFETFCNWDAPSSGLDGYGVVFKT